MQSIYEDDSAEPPEPDDLPVVPMQTAAPAIATIKPEADCKHSACRGWVKTEGAGPAARMRVGLILGFLLLLYVGLSLRLAHIQVAQGETWKQKADLQKTVRELQPGKRGPIYDATGELPLAYCIPRDTIIADMKLLKDREAVAKALAPILCISSQSLHEKMSRNDRRVIYLARNVEPELADKIRDLKIRGIGFEDEFRRTYPQGPLAANVLGWAGVDGGLEGLEKELNSLLSGTPGFLRYYRDAARRRIALNDGDNSDSRPPRDGLAVTITIHAQIQLAAEEELAKIMDEYKPKSATCTIIDVTTGAILAMACTPQFDPNEVTKSTPDHRRNRVVTDEYEPGSTFKTFTAALCLDKKLWRRNEMINCHNGAWFLGYRVLHDAHAYDVLSFDDVIVKSSNIGAAQIALRLGAGNFHAGLLAFGFGEKTNINLTGERRGTVHPCANWRKDSLYSVAMGHEVTVTPLQLVCAYAAVVNGGILYRPKIVQRIVNEGGEELYTLHAQPVRRVISEQTSKEMREILAKVVKPGGTALTAFCPEWAIGGKTGTTKKIDPATGTYSSTLYIGSFCGFAPVEQPRVVCLVTVDEPHKGSGYYGGTVAAPAVREVIRKALTVLNVPPRSADEQKKAIEESKKKTKAL
jgi:cell division protein FtsI (penicillin-binding protein 3)